MMRSEDDEGSLSKWVLSCSIVQYDSSEHKPPRDVASAHKNAHKNARKW